MVRSQQVCTGAAIGADFGEVIAVANQVFVELSDKPVHAEEAQTIRPCAPFRLYGILRE